MTPENYVLNERPEISIYVTIVYFKYLYLQQTVCVCVCVCVSMFNGVNMENVP